MISARNQTAAAMLALLVAGTASCAKTSGPTAVDPTEAPPATARDGAPVFPVPSDVEAAISKAGLRVVETTEPAVVELKAHLQVVIDGHKVTVPAGIGVLDHKRASPLTTRDDSGILHVASPAKETFRLGHLFQQWNVALDKNCVAARCASAENGKQLLAFVNGELAADPSTLQLIDGAEIVVWFGDRDTNPEVPTTFDFGG